MLSRQRSVRGTYLDDCAISHCDGSQPETYHDSGNRTHFESDSAKTGVQNIIDDGNKDDKRQWIDISQDVVRKSIIAHVGRHGGEIGIHLSVCHPINRIEEKDLSLRQMIK